MHGHPNRLKKTINRFPPTESSLRSDVTAFKKEKGLQPEAFSEIAI